MAKTGKPAKKKTYHNNLKRLLGYCASKKDITAVEDEQLLAAYLQYFSRRTDTRPLSRRMLLETGSLYNLTHLPAYHIRDAFGVSNVLAVAISNLGIVSTRVQMTTRPHDTLKTIEQFYNHLKPYFDGVNYEKTVVVCLNKKQQYIATETCTLYHPTKTLASASLILELAHKHHASKIVVAHNHPNCRVFSLVPSPADLQGTEQIQDLLELEEITLLEHILMAYDGCRILINGSYTYFDPEYFDIHLNTEYLVGTPTDAVL